MLLVHNISHVLMYSSCM